MNFFKQTHLFYRYFSNELLFNSIITSQNYKKNSFFEQLNKNYNIALNFISENKSLAYNPAIQKFYLYNEYGKFIQNFVKKDYEKSLEISLNLQKHFIGSEFEHFISNLNLIAITHLKATMPQNIYESKFKLTENETLSMSKYYAQNNKNDKLTTYYPTYMLLAFCAFLDNNHSEKDFCINEQFNKYGFIKTMSCESPKYTPWLYENINPSYLNFLSSTIDFVQSTHLDITNTNNQNNKIKN